MTIRSLERGLLSLKVAFFGALVATIARSYVTQLQLSQMSSVRFETVINTMHDRAAYGESLLPNLKCQWSQIDPDKHRTCTTAQAEFSSGRATSSIINNNENFVMCDNRILDPSEKAMNGDDLEHTYQESVLHDAKQKGTALHAIARLVKQRR